MKFRTLLLIAVTHFSGMSLPLYASNSSIRQDEDTVSHLKATNKLGEVVVLSRLTQREIIPSQQLKGKDLQRLNTQSIADALRYFAGLQIKDYGGIGGLKTVNMRSLGSQHTGIVYDGILLGNAQNGQIDLGQFSLDNVEEINIYNGQKSAIFQPASDFGNAGSVYIRTHVPRFTAGRNANFKIRTKYSSSNTFSLSTLWEQRISPAVSTSLNAAFLSSDGKYKFHHTLVAPDGVSTYDTLATRENGDIHAERVEANIHGLLPRGFWNAKAYLYNSYRGIPGAIVENVWRSEERQRDLNAFFQGRFQKDVTDRFSTQWLAKYAYYRTHYVNTDPNLFPVNNRYWQQEVYFSTANAYEILPSWTASLAYDFKWNKLNADTYRFAFPTRFSHLVSIATALDARFLKVQASLLMTHINDNVKNTTLFNPGAATITKYSPALFIDIPIMKHSSNGLSDGVTTSLSARAFAKQSFRMPTFNDLYYTDVGVSTLKPERANQYNIGFVFARLWHNSWAKELHIQADGYYNSIHNKIVAFPKGQQFRWTMLNLGRVHITGVDVAASYKFVLAMVNAKDGHRQPIDIATRLTYTYQDARDVTSSKDSFYKNQVPYVPHSSGSFILNADYGRWAFNYSVIYTGHRYNSKNNTKYTRMGSWITHDMSLQYGFTLGKMNWKATLEANNIFNNRYEVVDNYPMPGANGAIGLQMEF